ncbi:MAG TPA: hypothetical protein VFK50_02435 [Sphingomicrobium sp.]|nr:hypothetical protein [Sphingomicrobium sp.]
MKLFISTALAAALAVTLPGCKEQPAGGNAAATGAEAASLEALNGTWTFDLASAKFTGKPDEYLLKDGSYSCSTCIPPLTVPADGAFHPVADRPYYDSMSVKVVDARTVETRRRKGDKEVSSLLAEVSEDGNTLTFSFKDMTTPGQTIEGKSTAKRVGPAPAGAHAISGQWQADRIGEYSEAARDVTFAIKGDTVTSTGQGQTYTATIGGPAVPLQGDTGGTTVKVERDGNALKETYTRGGKVVGVATLTPNADGRTVSYSSTDPRDGSGSSFTLNKKS